MDSSKRPATPPLTTADGKTPLTPTSNQKPKSDIFHTLAKWLINIIGFIPRMLATIMENFSEAGSVGAILLGSLVFVTGVLFTADSYWQSLFQGAALMPFLKKRGQAGRGSPALVCSHHGLGLASYLTQLFFLQWHLAL